jgi:hypothetical protein
MEWLRLGGKQQILAANHGFDYCQGCLKGCLAGLLEVKNGTRAVKSGLWLCKFTFVGVALRHLRSIVLICQVRPVQAYWACSIPDWLESGAFFSHWITTTTFCSHSWSSVTKHCISDSSSHLGFHWTILGQNWFPSLKRYRKGAIQA